MSYSYKNILCRGMITLECVDEVAFYKAELMSSNGNIFRQGDKNTEITFIVFKGAENITDNFSDIEWKRFTPKSNGAEDKVWSKKHNGKKTITLTKEEVEGKCVIQCSAYSTIQGVRTLMAAASITFIDVNDFTPSKEPPSNPIDGDIWIDSSVDPPVIKIWDDEKKIWVEIEAAGSSTRNIINNSNFWKSYSIEDDFVFENKNLTYEHRIVPELNKRWAEIKTVQWDEVPRGIYQDINRPLYLGETYLFQVKAYTMNEAEGFYDGGITLEIVDVDNSLEEEVEISLKKATFKLKREIDTYYLLVTIPKKITKIRAKVYGENGSIFWIRFTELSLSHSSKLHEWELSQEDLEWKIDNKLSNDRESVFNALTDNGSMQGIYVATNEITGKPDYYINAEYIKSGKVTADHIDAKGLEVIKEDKTKTLEITKEGDVHIIADEFTLVPSAKTNVATEEQLNGKADATKEGIVNSLNDTGIFLQEGKLVINADNIATGILKSKDDKSVFNLDKGTFRVGENDEVFKMKYDGTDLLFGKGSIKWENLDDKIAENLSPYDAYLEKDSAIVPENINDTEVELSPEGEIIHIPDNKPINRVLVMKGNTKLNGVDGIEKPPKDGEFSFKIITQNGCTAIKISPESFYIDKMTLDTAYVKIEINCESKKDYIKTMGLTIIKINGVVGPPGEAGLSASMIYTKSLEEPETPKGDNPDGWFTRIEEIIEKGHLWCSQGMRKADTKELVGNWSKPFKLEKMEQNLLQNYPFKQGTGSQGIYEMSGALEENSRAMVKDYKGNRNIAWIATNKDNDISGGYDGGFIATVDIYSYTTYRYSVFVKQPEETNAIELAPSALNTVDFISGEPVIIPSMFDGKLPEKNKWYLIVGYLAGEGANIVPDNSGLYDVDTGERIAVNGKLELNTYRIAPGSDTQQMRARMYGANTTGAETYFMYPRIDIVDGNEPTIDSLLGKITNMKWIYEWNGTKTEINGSSVLSPKLFAGQIESNKTATGIAIGTSVINNEDSGIAGYYMGEKTFHIKTDGSAIFGKEDKDHISLQTDGTLILPKIKGENIEAKNLSVTYTNPETGEQVETLTISSNGEITMRPTKFEMLGQPSEEDGGTDALENQLGQLGFVFENNKFVINATNIKTNSLTADKLDLYGLRIFRRYDNGEIIRDEYGGELPPTLEITPTGEITMSPDSLKISIKTKSDSMYPEDNFEEVPLEEAFNPANLIDIINNTPEDVVIGGDHIKFKGTVSFESLRDRRSSDEEGYRTFIDGGHIMTNTLYINRLRPIKYWYGEPEMIKMFVPKKGEVDENGKGAWTGSGEIDAGIELTREEEGAIRFKLNKYTYVFISDKSFRVYLEDIMSSGSSRTVFSIGKQKTRTNYKGQTEYGDDTQIYTKWLVPHSADGMSRELGRADVSWRAGYFGTLYSADGTVEKRPTKKASTLSTVTTPAEDNFNFFKNYSINTEEIIVQQNNKNNIRTFASVEEPSLPREEDDLFIVNDREEVLMNTSLMTSKQASCLEAVTNRIASLEETCAYLNKENNKLKQDIKTLNEKLNNTTK